MIIVNSAAYVDSEFRNELGEIPPCFLPLGNQKLLQHQVSTLRRYFSDTIVVTLPQSYELSLDERRLLETLQISMLSVPDGLTLADALIYVLNVSKNDCDALRLLHGDTLILDLPHETDVVSVSYSEENYEWEFENDQSNENKDGTLVWSGYFAFSDKSEFLRKLVLSHGKFVYAVRGYGEKFPLSMVQCKDWFDLGHVNTYFFTRSRITTQRSFNELSVSDGVLYKSGSLQDKIDAESRWFRCVPPLIKKYTPNLLDSGQSVDGRIYYTLEFLPHLPLNELFVHGRNPISFWAQQLRLLKQYFLDARLSYQPMSCQETAIHKDAVSLYQQKTHARLKSYCEKSGVSLYEPVTERDGKPMSLEDIAQDCIHLVSKLPVIPAVLHGDFCFSNILFDSRSRRIKVIDPRGMNFEGSFSVYGDQKYDLAKLAHSVIGLYDFIIAGHYTITQDHHGREIIQFETDDRISAVQKMFLRTPFVDGLTNKDIMPLVVLLFLSMLPLHEDHPNRQRAMLLNAIRIYKKFL